MLEACGCGVDLRRELGLFACPTFLPTLLGRTQIARQLPRATRAECPSACAGPRAPRAGRRAPRERLVCAPLVRRLRARAAKRAAGAVSPRASSRNASASGTSRARPRSRRAANSPGSARRWIELEGLLGAGAQQIVDERSALADAVIVEHQRACRRAFAPGSTPPAAAAPSGVAAARRRGAKRWRPGPAARASSRRGPRRRRAHGYSVKSLAAAVRRRPTPAGRRSPTAQDPSA